MLHTILLTDIVNSTALTEALGNERMATIWQAHDRVARQLLVEHGGREGDRTDGFLMLFASPDEAIGYAEALHKALADISIREGIDFRARMGIHTGDIILIETPEEERLRGAKPLEVEGIAKPITARLMSIAHAGQTLISQDAVLRAGRDVSHSLGHWQIKGVSEPLEVFAVGEKQDPPADTTKVFQVSRQGDLWIPVRQIRNNLPAENDTFVGREVELAALGQAFEYASQITLLGPGGAGKTRLSRRFAWKNLHRFPGGIWFVELTEARTKEGIEMEVARVLDLPPAGDLSVQIGLALAARGPCLVILDNFEQVQDKAAETLGRWAAQASESRFLVTSRSRLGLMGEQVQKVDPLGLKTDAIELFSARARNRWSAFRLTEDTRKDIEIIVETLEGLPLAIELAAARTAVLSTAQIRERLTERFHLLASGEEQVEQNTLANAIAWSWNLLSESERSALRQLSVFEGGFRLEAAESVVDLSAWPGAPLTMDIIQHLVDKSLVRRDAAERFSLFVSIQSFAAEQLEKDAALATATRQRHQEYFRRYGKQNYRDRLGAAGVRHALVAETDNLLSACRRAIANKQASAAAELIAGFYEALQQFAPSKQLADLMDEVLAMPGIPLDQRAMVQHLSGNMVYQQGALEEALAHFQEAYACAVEADDQVQVGRILTGIGQVQILTGETEKGIASFEAAISQAKKMNDTYGEMAAVLKLAARAFFLGRHEQAEKETRSLSLLAEEIGDLGCAGRAAWLTGLGAMAKGSFKVAKENFAQAKEYARSLGDNKLINDATSALAQAYNAEGNFERAATTLSESLKGYREEGNRISTGITAGNIGFNLRSMGDLPGALQHFEEALAIATETSDQRTEAFWSGAMGDLLYDMEQPERSRALLTKALSIAQNNGALVTACLAQKALGRLDIREGKYAEATASLQKAMASAKTAKQNTMLLGAQAYYGLLQVLEGQHEKGQALIEETLSQVPSAERTLLLDVRLIDAEARALQGQNAAVQERLVQIRELASAMNIPMDADTPLLRSLVRIGRLLQSPIPDNVMPDL